MEFRRVLFRSVIDQEGESEGRHRLLVDAVLRQPGGQRRADHRIGKARRYAEKKGPQRRDRNSVVQGKIVSVRVDPGGLRTLKTEKIRITSTLSRNYTKYYSMSTIIQYSL